MPRRRLSLAGELRLIHKTVQRRSKDVEIYENKTNKSRARSKVVNVRKENDSGHFFNRTPRDIDYVLRSDYSCYFYCVFISTKRLPNRPKLRFPESTTRAES